MSEKSIMFNDLNLRKILEIQKKIDLSSAECLYLEEYAQRIAEIIYYEFEKSVILARAFITVPFSDLPKENKIFVRNLAGEKKITDLIKDNTPVLSLASSYGIEDAWKNRHTSKGHIGIPLVSEEFIELIPMIARLLKSFGVPLGWISGKDTGIVTKSIGDLSGIFYVPDAKTTVDEKGRKVIPNEKFVDKYGVKTVFGFGGSYLIEKTFVVFIIFTREEIKKESAELFMPVANLIKASTTHLVSNGKIFSNK